MSDDHNDFGSLFYSSNPDKACYRRSITISNSDDKYLRRAKSEIKQAIIQGFNNEKKSNDLLKTFSTPRFAQQGSYVYKTLNKPAYPPEQQLDMDYGVYLPFSALDDGRFPKKNATMFFKIIDDILRKFILESKNEWVLIDDKSTCCRVILRDDMHIDLPLYACPDTEMAKVVEEAYNFQEKQRSILDGYVLDDFESIDSNFIHLAKRDGNWIASDALIIRDWVNKKCNAYGNSHIKDICRYLKGWRDERPEWRSDGGPSSILLLALSIELYDDKGTGIHEKLFDVIKNLADRLNDPVEIYINKEQKEDLLERLDSNEIQLLQKSFDELKKSYYSALTVSDNKEANNMLIKLFGGRFPYRPESIQRTSELIRKTKAKAKVVTVPQSTTSG